MTLQETKEIIKRWLLSCETSEQLDLLLEVMDKFVFDRFAGSSPMVDLEMAKTELKEAWMDQKLLVVKNH